eukprot:scaffold8807_cov110-Isochrysis_galbana.AAC.4
MFTSALGSRRRPSRGWPSIGGAVGATPGREEPRDARPPPCRVPTSGCGSPPASSPSPQRPFSRC